MIIRGGGAIGAAGFAGAEACICVTLLGKGGCTAGGALPSCAAGVVARGGTAITGAAVFVADETAAGVLATGGGTGTLGGITTTVGGRYVAATEAGVTILGAGGAGASLADLGGIAFGGVGAAGCARAASVVRARATNRTPASVSPSIAGAVTGGLTAGRATGCSAASFCCVIARSTSPGREICERSILVLISSSPGAVREDGLAEPSDASERPRRCFRTRSAS
jgi:hypothetical protein